MQVLLDTKKEYIEHLLDTFSTPLAKKIYKMYNETNMNISLFQKELVNIKNWNNNKIKDEYNDLVKKTNCKYLDKLLEKIILIDIQLKIDISKIKLTKNDLDIIKGYDFIHKCYINISIYCWKNVYLFATKNLKPSEKQYHLNLIEKNIRKIIKNTIRDIIPFEKILELTELLERTTSDNKNTKKIQSKNVINEPDEENEEDDDSESEEDDESNEEDDDSEAEEDDESNEEDDDSEAEEDDESNEEDYDSEAEEEDESNEEGESESEAETTTEEIQINKDDTNNDLKAETTTEKLEVNNDIKTEIITEYDTNKNVKIEEFELNNDLKTETTIEGNNDSKVEITDDLNSNLISSDEDNDFIDPTNFKGIPKKKKVVNMISDNDTSDSSSDESDKSNSSTNDENIKKINISDANKRNRYYS